MKYLDNQRILGKNIEVRLKLLLALGEGDKKTDGLREVVKDIIAGPHIIRDHLGPLERAGVINHQGVGKPIWSLNKDTRVFIKISKIFLSYPHYKVEFLHSKYAQDLISQHLKNKLDLIFTDEQMKKS